MLLNSAQISSAKIFKKLLNHHYQWRDESKFFGFKTREAGFYDVWCIGTPQLITKEIIEEKSNSYIEKNYVFYYPHIEFRMSDGIRHDKFFKTADELEMFLKTPEMIGITWIEIN